MTDMGQEIKYVLSLWTTIVTLERADADIIQGERNQWLTECLNLANDCANHCIVSIVISFLWQNQEHLPKKGIECDHQSITLESKKV